MAEPKEKQIELTIIQGAERTSKFHTVLQLLSTQQNGENGTESDSVKPPELIKILFLDLTFSSPLTQIAVLTLGLFVFFQACAWIEEQTFKGFDDFQYAWFMTAFELLCVSAFSLLERWKVGEEVFAHSVPLREHLGIALAMAFARGLTNLSLEYISFPTQVVFKSMKLLPIMIGSVFYLSNKHSVSEWISVFLLALSAAIFSVGDKQVTPDFNVTGIVIVLLSLLGDAAHSNSQERVVKQLKAGHLETMFYSNFFSLILVLFICATVGQLEPALRYCNKNSTIYYLWFFRAFVIYFGVQCFLLLVKVAGNVMAQTLGAIRKITTILLSFLFFPKPFSTLYLYGLATFLISCGLSIYVVLQKNRQTKK